MHCFVFKMKNGIPNTYLIKHMYKCLYTKINKQLWHKITSTMPDVKIKNGILNTYYVIFVHKNKLTNLAFIHIKSDI